ncbi:MAG TPA: HAD-IC family P-type ATPase [Ilumatobacter sp.]|nr:HAD-IC family P-type ATPase [Ilumatobacter sp.]
MNEPASTVNAQARGSAEIPGDAMQGLTADEVRERVADGRVNTPPHSPDRSVLQIVRDNVITPVNAIMLVLFALVLVSGNWRDGLFVGVVLSNSVVGVTQEYRARRQLARLTVLTEPHATVVRDGERAVIPADEVVIDEIVHLAPGGQVPVDGTVLAETGLQVDESMLTGESDTVPKAHGDEVLSGSYVVAGSGLIRATAVGADSYASDLTLEAKRFDAAESNLRRSINTILRWLTVIIPIASVLLFIRLLGAEDRWQDALQGTVAAAVAMVPDGLVLLTSLAFVAGMLELARRNVLAKQLTTVELLARVDTLCLDKTGTITTGHIAWCGSHPLGDVDGELVTVVLAAIVAADDAPNATMVAVGRGVGAGPGWPATSVEPFSSARKWSAVEFGERGWYYVGGFDVVLGADASSALIADLSGAGKRLIGLASSPKGPAGDDLPNDLMSMAVIELEDEIRPDANEILAYFADQQVRVKVISGDNHLTVAAVARRAGLHPRGEAIDARELPDEGAELLAMLEDNDVFGRVRPRQKQAMVKALKANGHVVAMTGDGVNDVLALKDADLGIAMGSGSEATRSIADLVLTDDAFATLPIVVTEGRKVINNVERVANLFVTKAVYAVLLTAAIGAIGSPFPFLPRHLTLVGTFSIGVPGFFLALAPETRRVRTGFLDRVLRFSVPTGVIAGASTLAAYEWSRRSADLSLSEARTLATITLLAIGLVILLTTSRPLRVWKVGLTTAMAASYVVVMAIPWTRDYFELDLFTGDAWLIVAGAVLVATAGIVAVPRFVPGLAWPSDDDVSTTRTDQLP